MLYLQISAVAKKYRVYFSAPEVKEGDDEHYLVDHSIFFYLTDRRGQFMEYFGKFMSAEDVAHKLSQIIREDNRK